MDEIKIIKVLTLPAYENDVVDWYVDYLSRSVNSSQENHRYPDSLDLKKTTDDLVEIIFCIVMKNRNKKVAVEQEAVLVFNSVSFKKAIQKAREELGFDNFIEKLSKEEIGCFFDLMPEELKEKIDGRARELTRRFKLNPSYEFAVKVILESIHGSPVMMEKIFKEAGILFNQIWCLPYLIRKNINGTQFINMKVWINPNASQDNIVEQWQAIKYLKKNYTKFKDLRDKKNFAIYKRFQTLDEKPASLDTFGNTLKATKCYDILDEIPEVEQKSKDPVSLIRQYRKRLKRDGK